MNAIKFQWRYVLELVGAISIVSSLIFVGLELRQAQRSTDNERTVSRVELGKSTRDAINQYPDIWLRGNKGEELNEVERLLYSNLIRNMDAEMDAIGLTAIALGRSLETNLGVMGFSSFLHENPGALQQWKDHFEEFREPMTILSGGRARMSPVRIAILEHLEILDSSSEN